MKLKLVLLLVLSAQAVFCEDAVISEEEEDGGRVEETVKKEFTPPPRPEGDVYFVESFSDPENEVFKRWIRSEATKDGADEDVAKYDGVWKLEELQTDGGLDDDIGLVMSKAAKHYAISSKLERPFKFEGTDSLVVQYEVNFQSGLNCGGAYVKLLSDEDGTLNLAQFQDKTPYSIMFGPDKCGMSSKVHFIIRFKNPVTGEVEEKHSKQSTESMGFFDDKKTHLFTLLIHSDGSYHVIVDQTPFLKGNLLEDFTPSIVPDQEIDDPNDKMPENWDEREKIPDPEAEKPDDWDEDAPPKIPDPDAVKPDGWLEDGPEFVPDPDASMPDDWDEEEDGEWEAPMIPNPECEAVGCGEWSPPMIQNPSYKGKWKAPLIDNPEYDGKWAPRKIENPAYFEDETPYFSLTPIMAVGFELWSMNDNIFFDNIIVTSELAIANNYARDGWTLKHESERAVGGAMSVGPFLDTFIELANTYPYLWALYAIAVVAPFVCCAACCIKSKSKPQDDAAKRKKTDESTPDDPQEEKKEENKPETEEGQSFVASAEEEEEETKEGTPGPQSGGEGSQGEASQGEASQEEASQEEGGEEEQQAAAVEETKPKKSTRKRKTRRED